MAPGASATSCVCRVLLGARESEARSSACRREEGPRNGPGVGSLGVDLFQSPDGERKNNESTMSSAAPPVRGTTMHARGFNKNDQGLLAWVHWVWTCDSSLNPVCRIL